MRTRNIRKSDPRSLRASLRTLAYNLWWIWNPDAQQIFRELSPLTWERSNHNTIAVLRSVSDDELLSRLYDPDFAGCVAQVLEEFNSYMDEQRTWFRHQYPKAKGSVAYFSAEFGLHESLPIYSGGLGVLAGDHIKSASDLGIPFIGVGLFYRQGYFQQRIDPNGWQQEVYPTCEPDLLPLELVTLKEGGRLLNTVEIGHSSVYFQAWRAHVGRCVLYLLDTHLPENDPHYQRLTAQVYGGDIDTRISQEIVLGIGGIRLLRSLRVTPSVFHMNEGHSAFLVLELVREEMLKGKNFGQARESVRQRCVFTTHTPVPAGHDRFSYDSMRDLLGKFWSTTGLSMDQLMPMGRVHPAEPSESFTMTVLALKMSRAANAVSELHGHTSREMWKELYLESPDEKVPIEHITNGVHTPSWGTTRAHEFWNKRLGVDWTDRLIDPKFWKRIEVDGLASDEELWALRCMLRRELIEFVRQRLYEQHLRIGVPPQPGAAEVLSPDALTICFARRFATYKRAPLIFRHPNQIIPLLTQPEHPVQIIFSGKAHPRDEEGKKFIQHIIEMSHHPQLHGRVVFLENYDMNIARYLIAGADVWLNNPRRPFEASGTSGQKAVIHGGLNLSIMDGWWREAFDGTNGWAIGDDSSDPHPETQDEKDSHALLSALSTQVIPEFFDRDRSGIPRRWIKRMRRSMRTLLPVYNTDRMLAEYVRKYYCR